MKATWKAKGRNEPVRGNWLVEKERREEGKEEKKEDSKIKRREKIKKKAIGKEGGRKKRRNSLRRSRGAAGRPSFATGPRDSVAEVKARVRDPAVATTTCW